MHQELHGANNAQLHRSGDNAAKDGRSVINWLDTDYGASAERVLQLE